ncbi:MAG: DNA mismatch repair protein MutS [Dehalococcoidia bacterium]|nr:DNA mismatch repair protein MutS [Dehalococcoidia bacterium]
MTVTPLRRQYLRVKQKHPGAIVFFRLGDFYEMFDEDARIGSRELDIVLTAREMGKGNNVPMAGIPHHALDGYLGRLITRGYKVAVCEQLTPPGNGLVERDVVRVVTPGTVVEPFLLKAKSNNYLVSVYIDHERAGLAYADVSTGECAVTEMPIDQLECEMERLNPAESLVQASGEWVNERARPVTKLDDYWYEYDVSERLLLEHFEVATLEGFGCARLPRAIRAAGALVHYLQETQKESLRQLIALSTYSTESYMTLDGQTKRNLELFEGGRWGTAEVSLLSILDETKTPMGGRLLRTRLGAPLVDIAALSERQALVDWFFGDTIARREARGVLSKIADLERLQNRIVSGRTTPRELAGLRAGLAAIPVLRDAVGDGPPSQRECLVPVPDVVSLLNAALDDEPGTLEHGGVIREGFSRELDEVRSKSRDARKYLADLEQRERERTGIKSLKVGYNRVFGYYIEVSRANLQAVPDDYVRKQTLSDAERFYTPELKEYEALVLSAGERISELEESVFRQLCEQVAGYSESILSVARAVAVTDVSCSLAEVAVRRGYVRPELDEGTVLDIRWGRHPIVEARLESGEFVPNDTFLSDEDSQIVILTGPNMAGKSTYLRQVALIVLMAQIGSFVPATSARVGLVDRIFTRVGAQEDLASGQSTFMVEMIETANILHHAGPRSLLVLDEIGRGTSTYDGISIAWAVAEYIHNHPSLGARTVFATHYHELVQLAERLPRVKNFNVAVVEEQGKVRLLHRIASGGADKSYGIHVAKLAGLPRAVVSRAQDVLDTLEVSSRGRTTSMSGAKVETGAQMSLFGADRELTEDMAKVDVDSMTPLEAIGTLYELRDRARRTIGTE